MEEVWTLDRMALLKLLAKQRPLVALANILTAVNNLPGPRVREDELRKQLSKIKLYHGVAKK
jgi:hypothetical protein